MRKYRIRREEKYSGELTFYAENRNKINYRIAISLFLFPVIGWGFLIGYLIDVLEWYKLGSFATHEECQTFLRGYISRIATEEQVQKAASIKKTTFFYFK